jgi:hypothetical protein
MPKPRVLLKCVANHYAARDERIIEFSFSDGSGGLIAFHEEETNLVNVYRVDKNINVRVNMDNGEVKL